MELKLSKIFYHQKTQHLVIQFLGLLIFLLVIDFIGYLFLPIKLLMLINFGLIGFWLCYHFFTIAFYLMVIFTPLYGWEIIVGDFNEPIVDVWATILFVAWCWRLLWHPPAEKFNLKRDFPGLFFFLMFILSGVFSLINAPNWLISLKFLVRTIIFFYLCFVVLPVNFIKEKKQLTRIFQLLYFVGLIIAILSLTWTFITPGDWYAKFVEFPVIKGFNLLGGNHNAVAEILIIAIPAGLILLTLFKKQKLQSLILIGLIFMSLVLILTYSRSGWLAFLVMFAILFFFSFGSSFPKLFWLPIIIFFILLPLILYLTIWHNTAEVQSSNENRLLMTQIAYHSFLEEPLIGHGLNTFRSQIEKSYAYLMKFGSAMESHGFIQKIIVEQGLFGLVAFLGFIFSLMRIFLRAFREENNYQERFYLVVLIMMFAGIITFQLFSTSYYIAKTWLPIGIGLAAVKIYKRNN